MTRRKSCVTAEAIGRTGRPATPSGPCPRPAALRIRGIVAFGPLIVESDLEGNSLFEQQNARINQRIAMLYEGLKEPALRRHGETDDKTEELI